MPEEEFQRKLIAILSADAAGYSLLMRDDEAATVRTITAYRKALDQLIQQYRGRVVDAPGDNILAEFTSVVDAVTCSVEIQRELAERNAESKRLRKLVLMAVAASMVMVAIGPVVWNHFIEPPVLERASAEKMAIPLPDKPSIAVLPFDNLSGDPTQEYLGDGLTDELIATLSRVPDLFVIARNSTFTYKGKPVIVQEVSETLGVRYVLEGSVKKAGNRIRITAQLIDALSGHHLWANQYDRSLDDLFAVQDEITKKIITAMQVRLTEGERARTAAKGTQNLEAYLKYMQANESIYLSNREAMTIARQLAEEAIALDPEYAMPYVALAHINIRNFWYDKGKSQKRYLAEATELLQKAIALDDSNAEAYSALGFVYIVSNQNEKALVQAERAVRLDPNSSTAHYGLGKVLAFDFRHEKAIAAYKKAIRLDPMPPNSYFWSIGLSYAGIGNYAEGIAWCQKAIQQEPDSLPARIMMTGIYSLAGQEKRAQEQALEVLRINPDFSLERFAKRASPRLTEALRKAGLK